MMQHENTVPVGSVFNKDLWRSQCVASKMRDAWDTVVFKADNVLACKGHSILVEQIENKQISMA